MIRIDLHTHSIKSPDGSITFEQYKDLIESKTLDVIAITDHDEISYAVEVQKKLGKSIIVGQEITTLEGEIIGLYLTSRIDPGQSAIDTSKQIKAQGGLVYIPHPFETVRSGISLDSLNSISELVDIVEAHNGRAVFQNKGAEALAWARRNNKSIASSSDAHGVKGVGHSFTSIKEAVTKTNIVKQLYTGRLSTKRPPLATLLYPKLNRLRAKIKHKYNK